MGRRKIEMKMVSDANSRQVTFSKRRNGLFKKANELVALCAAQVAIIVFSPGGKPFSFGHPNLDFVSQRFLTQVSAKLNRHAIRSHRDQPRPQQREGDGDEGVEALNQQLTDLLEQLELEKKRRKELDKALKEEAATYKHSKALKKMDNDELFDMQKSLEILRQKLKGRATEMEASSSLLLLNNPLQEFDN